MMCYNMLENFFDIYLFVMITAKYVYYVTFRGCPLIRGTIQVLRHHVFDFFRPTNPPL